MGSTASFNMLLNVNASMLMVNGVHIEPRKYLRITSISRSVFHRPDGL